LVLNGLCKIFIEEKLVIFCFFFQINRLRALSTPDSATPIPSSSGSGSGNVFKFSATRYRYSKDEILALRANVSECLTETIQNEIMENLKDVESVFRANILDPLSLTAPTAEETVSDEFLFSKKKSKYFI
jgi:hypothetical protein